MVAASKSLGIGIFTPSEAAFYARVRTQTISRWIHGDGTGPAVVRAELEGDEEKIVTFKDFVQALAIRSIRTQYPIVSLQKLRKSVSFVREERGIDYPLAVPHRTFVITHGSQAGEIAFEIDGMMIQVSGKKKDQILIGPIAELYMEDLTFDASHNPIEYTAWSGRGGKITMNPHMRFGEPLVSECGYSARTLWEASINEGGLDAASEAYGVQREQVALACAYYDHLTSASV